MSLRETTVLAIDDDPHMLKLLRRLLELDSYRVITATQGEQALEILDNEVPELILLDIMMPRMDGYTVCERIREFSKVPIIVITAKGESNDKIKMLTAGADDYITKPFSSQELLARAKAVLRRSTGSDTKPAFNFDDLRIDLTHHTVTLRGQQVSLTKTEYNLLRYLATNAGNILTSDQILENVWGEEYIGDSHLLQVGISRLRRKLNDSSQNLRYILTKSGIGYTMPKSS